MNENLNLVEILKDCPKGTKLYSTVYGEVEFDGIENGKNYPVWYVNSEGRKRSVTAQGLLFSYLDGDCTLFPSKEQRDWDLFTVPDCKKGKFDPRTLRPFDRVLVRDSCAYNWKCAFYSHKRNSSLHKYVTTESIYEYCIPYNDDTKHLVGTKDEAPEYYRYWEV